MLLVTGSTGFLGSHTIPKLIDQYKGPIRCFVRETSDIEALTPYRNIEIVYGSFEENATFEKALDGVDTLLNIASLGFGHGPSIVDTCEKMNLNRAIFVSTTAIFTQLNAGTKVVRGIAEDAIRSSNLNYVIVRPTMIYGTHKDRNMCRLVKILKKTPAFPIFGSGEYLQQPIHVDDLAQALVDLVNRDDLNKKEYNVSGSVPLTFNQVIHQTADALGKKVKKIHVPVKPVLIGLSLYEKISKKPKLKGEQVLRLNENKAFSSELAEKDFGFVSRSFSQGIKDEIVLMKKKGIL